MDSLLLFWYCIVFNISDIHNPLWDFHSNTIFVYLYLQHPFWIVSTLYSYSDIISWTISRRIHGKSGGFGDGIQPIEWGFNWNCEKIAQFLDCHTADDQYEWSGYKWVFQDTP